MYTDTCHFPAQPNFMRRTDSNSSIGSSSSRSSRTPTDSIFHRDDEDFGGEPGLVMEDLAEAIKTLLMDDKPLLDMDNACLQIRMTKEEVKRLTEVLSEDSDLEVTQAKSLLARHLPGTVSYNVALASALNIGRVPAWSDSCRFSLHEFSKPAPRFTASEYADDQTL
ncbi:hypothetical protein NliqN6_5280 [Naganishia liquefaciens]|uniref:Uncharacterized protein n=1 Tax=Naganishia liquefaciens TaxID=104408 RepID=A0A8H3TXY0_9TREE|nr:hypothetical protein NliqN6_5280 [Naganishia liquefaciens]